MTKRTGVLLLNLGTPSSASVADVAAYLKQFLSDPRVIELPTILRWLLVRFIIVPFRAKKSAAAYAKIWQAAGSPLLVNCLLLKNKLAQVLGNKYVVELGMSYGQPNISSALQELQQAAVNKIIILPLFPQYSSAATGSPLQEVLQRMAKYTVIPELQIKNSYFTEPSFIQALAVSVQPYLQSEYDYLLMSYHGLPAKNIAYQEQCYATSRLLAANLGLPAAKWGVSFQSRLGRMPWLKPYTDEMLVTLSQQGIKKLVVCCPSFVVDCLETLEEIEIRAKEQWLSLGGASLQLVPCLNAQDVWVAALADMAIK